MRILVTGGTGFVGTHLCRELSKQGYTVTVFDLKPPAHTLDVRNFEQVQTVVRANDHVFHLAAIASMPYCQAHPIESYQTNVMGTANVLEAIRLENKNRKEPIRLIFTSSSAVYGGLGKQGAKLSEKQNLREPLSFYAAQKLAAEHMIKNYCEHHAVPAMVFRPFNIYGLGQDLNSPYAGVMTLYLSALQKGLPLKVDGSGKQTRDFIHVDDVVGSLIATLKVPTSKFDAEPMNLGSGKSITIIELAKKMLAASGSKVKLERTPSRQGDVSHSCADIRKVSQALKWKPRIDLKTGLSTLFENHHG
jgi:UDP-glucose 4-epimerase